jgi:hypothetical protein
MKSRTDGVHQAARVLSMAIMVLVMGVSAGWADSGQRTLLPSRSKGDVLKGMVKAGVMPASHLPKSLRAPCKGGGTLQNATSYSQFAEVEITITNTVSLKRLRSYPLAPGSTMEMLDNGTRIRAQLPAPIVATLIEEGAKIKVIRDFLLWEKSAQSSDAAKSRADLAAAATCSGSTLRQGTNGTNYTIPEGEWAYSDIAITGAPTNAQVTCVDVHYEIVHPVAGDVVVDLTDEDMTYEYHLHTSSEADTSVNIKQTVTGITLFSGQNSGYAYGAEGVNQKWTLWATDEYTGYTGYIDTWWIKVYYSVPASSPVNDACTKAIVLTDNSPYSGTTVGATGSYETLCGFYDGLDTWHVFTPTQNGLVTVTAVGVTGQNSPTFDPTLAVFDACGGKELACDDDDCADQYASKITLQMFRTKTYYIRVAGYDYRTGTYSLTVQQHTAQIPSVPGSPSPADGAESVETQVVLSWNNSAGLVNALNIPKEKETETETAKPSLRNEYSQLVVYGKDNRTEEYQVTNSAYRHAGDATVMLVYATDLVSNGDGTYTLSSKTFADWYRSIDPIGTGLPLCSTEPFRNQPAPGVCSGVLVAPNIVATAGHCVACETIGNLAVVFGFVMANATTPTLTIPEEDVYWCSEVIAYHNQYPDWSLIRLDRNVTSHVPAALGGRVPDAQPLLLVGHPWGIPRKYDAGGTVRDNTPVTYFQANVDAYQGNSGSPIFNRSTLKVEGLVSTGKQDFVTNSAGTCDISNICPDTGCPSWEDITRIEMFSGVIPSFDVYLGTSSDSMTQVASYSRVPWLNPGTLKTGTTYYWKVVARNAWTERTSGTWSFQTVASSVYKPLYRFLSTSTGEHFLTISEGERTKLLNLSRDWTPEGVAFYAFNTAQSGAAAVYRFWSSRYRDHFFTIKEGERTKLQGSSAWTEEGIKFYAYPAGNANPQPAGTRPVYRFLDKKTGQHFFTISESERDKLVSQSTRWTSEGVAWYAIE